MKKLLLLSAVPILLFSISCEGEKKTIEETEVKEIDKVGDEKKEEATPWSYDGESSPEHWAEIEKNSMCGGNHQSPIDIVTADLVKQASGLKVSDIHYSAVTKIKNVTNNGHSVQYNFDDKENYVDFKGKRYDLVQFHFHAASEHSVNGMHFPLVLHMVHVSSDKQYVVFAIMISEGKESKSFDFLAEYLPVKSGETKPIDKEHSFSKYIKDDFKHYYYQGSLTTPPCTEAVDWFIFVDPLEASPEQVKQLAELMPRNNFRPTQPLNDRKVYLSN